MRKTAAALASLLCATPALSQQAIISNPTTSASSLSTGTVPIARIPTGTTSSTVAIGNDSRITGALQASSNLSDVPSAASARTNLGVPATGVLLAVTVFTTSGTWTPNAATKSAIVDTWGAGGGAGGAVASASNTAAAGGGGGGSYNKSLLTGAAIAAQTITIGTGGSGGANTGTDGSDGGTTTVGALVSCPGGLHGTGNATPTTSVTLTAGGTSGSGCTASGTGLTSLYSISGDQGRPGISYNGTACLGGDGGYSMQGRRAIGSLSGGNAINGVNGGGGGGGCSVSATGKIGGNGGDGRVVVYEFG